MVGIDIWAKKKTYGVEICMARLVLDLCQAAGLLGLPEDQLESLPSSIRPYASLSSEEAQNLSQQLELELITLHSFKNLNEMSVVRRNFCVPLPQYRNEYSARTEQFNQGLARICSRKTYLSTQNVANICAHVLNSRGRPDIQSVNHLLVTFNRCQRNDLLKPTISLISDGHFRPNEITCASILRFYRQQNDEIRFMEYIALMRGEQGALMLARRHMKTIMNSEPSQGRIIPVGKKLLQGVTPSSLTLLEMIMGLAHFVGIEKTWTFCTNLGTLGWGFDYACIYMLLFRSSVESVSDICEEVWKEAEKLSALGYRLPKRLYALMIAIHKLENDQDRSWFVFEECIKQHPANELSLLVMVQERMRLIKQTRLAEKKVQQQVFDQLEAEEQFGPTAMPAQAIG
jgi:hypothetical protein